MFKVTVEAVCDVCDISEFLDSVFEEPDGSADCTLDRELPSGWKRLTIDVEGSKRSIHLCTTCVVGLIQTLSGKGNEVTISTT